NASQILEPFKEVLDLWTSQYFGNKEVRNLFLSAGFPEIRRGWQKAVGTKANTTVSTGHEVAKDKRFFHWQLEFPEVFFEKGREKENPGFDAVVGNPPYVGIESIPADLKNYLQGQFISAVGRFDLYFVFLETCAMIARDNANFSLITPNKYLVTHHGKSLRKLLRSYGVTEIRDFKDFPVFQDATCYPAVGIFGKPEENIVRYVDCSRWPIFFEHQYQADILSQDKWTFAATNAKKFVSSQVPVLELKKLTDHSFEGLISGHNEVFIIPNPKATELSLEKELLHPCPKGAFVERFDLLEAPNLILYPYKVNEAGSLAPVDLSRYPKIESYLLMFREELSQRASLKGTSKKWFEHIRPRHPSWFLREKIYVPNLANRCRFHFDDGEEQYLFLDHDCYGIALKNNEYSPLMILSLLNSKYIPFLFLQMSTSYRGGYVKFHTQYLENLPIRRVSFGTRLDRRKALAEHSRTLYQQYLSENVWSAASASPPEVTQSLHSKTHSKVLGFVEEQLVHEPERSDVVHDLLAFLAEEMIRLNKEKQAEIKRLLGWLQKETAMTEGIESLSGKTTIKNYLGDYQKNESQAPFAHILRVLQKNKRKLGVSLGDSKLLSELENEYEASLATLLPTKEKLARTDRLIDQIVYKLYGLTEEEIAIVEGK
ncbi:MAG: Eco57I restriction-modification methylase domain-containing protein, partial [bacterium]